MTVTQNEFKDVGHHVCGILKKVEPSFSTGGYTRITEGGDLWITFEIYLKSEKKKKKGDLLLRKQGFVIIKSTSVYVFTKNFTDFIVRPSPIIFQKDFVKSLITNIPMTLC